MSYEKARAVGVPHDRMVFLHAGTDGADPLQVTRRERFDTSTAMRSRAVAPSTWPGIGPADLRHVDLYSCFPSAVEIAARELGLAETRDLTVTGGLTFAGGPWNNYVTHAVATMVERLRSRTRVRAVHRQRRVPHQTRLRGLLIRAARPTGSGTWRPRRRSTGSRRCEPAGDVDGTMTLEAYTVMHDRDSNPETGIAVMRTADGRRAWA